MSSSPRQIDSRIEIVTPENIAFEYRVAGPFTRLPAYLFDRLLQSVAMVITFIALIASLGSVGQAGLGIGFWLVLSFVISWFYGGLFEAYWNGQTPGKRLMGIRVVSIDGQPITGWQAVLRNILREADAFPCFLTEGLQTFQVGFLACLMNDRYQRLGDLTCGTMVVFERKRDWMSVSRVSEPLVDSLYGSIPPRFRVDRQLALALSKYVERRRYFSLARRAELAAHLGRLLIARFGLPRETNADALLCALYNHAFVGEMPDDAANPQPARDVVFVAAMAEVVR